MRITVQTWRPDTCGCQLHLAFDADLPDDQREVKFVTREEAEAIVAGRRAKGESVTRAPQPAAVVCPHHAALGNTPVLHSVVAEENRRKNTGMLEIHREMVAALPDEYTGVRFEAVKDHMLAQLSVSEYVEYLERPDRQADFDESVRSAITSALVSWEFDAERNLVFISRKALPPNVKTASAARLDARFGAGKVRLTREVNPFG